MANSTSPLVTTPPIRISNATEYDPLRTVVMSLAADGSALSGALRAADVALFHQMLRNRARPFDSGLVREQQQHVMDVLREEGATVLLATNTDSLSQHFTRDIGFAIDDAFIVARPRREQRQEELRGIRHHVSRMSRVIHLDSGTIEGGDVMLPDRDTVLVGLSEETSLVGVEALTHSLKAAGIERRIEVLRFRHRGTIHLDTKFNVIAPNLALIWAQGFEPASLRWLRDHFDLIEATRGECRRVEINTFSVGPDAVIMQERSKRLADKVADHGLRPILVDYSEVTTVPGSFRCSTLPLERESGA